MTKPSRFLSLAVSFLGLGFASACTYSKSLPTTAYDDSSTPEITEPEATPELPSEISKDLETEDTNEVIAPVEAAYAPDETDTDLGANDETDVEAPTDATQESPETPKDPGSGEI